MKEWRLVHNDKQVITLFECDVKDRTETPYTLFTGTEQECREEITRLGLEFEEEGYP